MKKTLIALAVAASAAVSGSAMADDSWITSGTGGGVTMAGNITLASKVAPWDVKVGSAVTGLDTFIQKGKDSASVTLKQSIPVLGIRSSVNGGFKGMPGFTPNIDYGKAIDVNNIKHGTALVNLDVTDDKGEVIGRMSAPLYLAAEGMSYDESGNRMENFSHSMLYASDSDKAFFGGISKVKDEVWSTSDAHDFMLKLFPGINANWMEGVSLSQSPAQLTPIYGTHFYNGMYASGFQSGKDLVIKLNNPANGDISWKAVFPVTVSYV